MNFINGGAGFHNFIMVRTESFAKVGRKLQYVTITASFFSQFIDVHHWNDRSDQLPGDPCPRAWSVSDPRDIVREAAEYLKEQAKDRKISKDANQSS